MRGFYFSPHPNYYTLLVILFSMVMAILPPKGNGKYKYLNIAIVIGLFWSLGFVFNKLAETSEKHNSFRHYKMASFIHQNTNKDDIVMNGYDKNFNIYRSDASYFWFGLVMLIPEPSAAALGLSIR